MPPAQPSTRTSLRPAGAEKFDPAVLQRVTPLPVGITREWAWGGSTGSGVDVAVVDSGVEDGHPWVGRVDSAVALSVDESQPEGVRLDVGSHDDLFGHGTACAGIIRRLAPDCRLHSVRVLGDRLTGRGPVFAAGVRWALDQGFPVVNLSLSTGRDEYHGLFHDLADEAYFRGTALVCAVNNAAVPSYPSQFSAVFSVAAHERNDPERFDFNPDPPVEFGAPGVDVEVAWRGGATLTATGNSFAAPHIAGLVVRILGKHPGLTPFQLKTVLHALADNAVNAEEIATPPGEGDDTPDRG
ncbi:MAG: S8 family serine peptidase [Actinomycetota bacterium]|nr:S8 family serine peptidase [Actinomycetota bacterium]